MEQLYTDGKQRDGIGNGEGYSDLFAEYVYIKGAA